MTFPIYPCHIGECGNDFKIDEALFDLECMCFVFSQHSMLSPMGSMEDSYICSVNYIQLDLQAARTMVSNRIHKVYKPSSDPTLCVGRIEDLLGRVLLIPCFLDGNSTSTIP